MTIVLRQEIEIEPDSKKEVADPVRAAIGSFWDGLMSRSPEKHSVLEWSAQEFDDFVQTLTEVAMAQTIRQQIKVITLDPVPFHA